MGPAGTAFIAVGCTSAFVGFVGLMLVTGLSGLAKTKAVEVSEVFGQGGGCVFFGLQLAGA